MQALRTWLLVAQCEVEFTSFGAWRSPYEYQVHPSVRQDWSRAEIPVHQFGTGLASLPVHFSVDFVLGEPIHVFRVRTQGMSNPKPCAPLHLAASLQFLEHSRRPTPPCSQTQ